MGTSAKTSGSVMGISNDAVVKATGVGWDEWFALLDQAGARDWSHKEMVAFVAGNGLDNAWWQQMVTSTYERERGLKQVGETDSAGFQIGVQRAMAMPQEALWHLLMDREGLALWLGELDGLVLEPGAPYRTADGTRGEVRTIRPGSRIRMTWQPSEQERPATLQVTLACPRNSRHRTTLRFHLEKLAGPDHRERMRAHWKSVATKLAELASSAP